MNDQERPETQENFGEASLGEAQSENPALDPEMLEDDAEQADTTGYSVPPAEDGEGTDSDGGIDPDGGQDPDAGPASTADELENQVDRDQAEG